MADAIQFCRLPVWIRRSDQPEARLDVFGTIDGLDLKNLASGRLGHKKGTAGQGSL
jgi:hypothetical protein